MARVEFHGETGEIGLTEGQASRTRMFYLADRASAALEGLNLKARAKLASEYGIRDEHEISRQLSKTIESDPNAS